jgi:hypothetical protein
MAINAARRKFIAALGGAVAAWPLVAQGQQAATRHLGVLLAYDGNDSVAKDLLSEFRRQRFVARRQLERQNCLRRPHPSHPQGESPQSANRVNFGVVMNWRCDRRLLFTTGQLGSPHI